MTKILLFFLAVMVSSYGVLPVFAEVTEIHFDKNSYLKGDSINARGIVSSDSSGLVTIVVRDPNDKFVLLSQAFIHSNDSFEQTIPINEKFQVLGTYNATAFIQNMTAGKTQSFEIVTTMTEEIDSSNELSANINDFEPKFNENLIISEPENPSSMLENEIEDEILPENPNEKVSEKISRIADFVDDNKDPQYYLDRYNNEPGYKSWFDRNYPNLTIEEAIGYTPNTVSELESINNIVGKEIIPEAEAISVTPEPVDADNNGDIAQIGLAVGGLAILFAAVYGIKKKVDTNTRHISWNKDIIKQKIISPIIDSNPITIIQTRLAKGEISIEEYENLKQQLEKNSK